MMNDQLLFNEKVVSKRTEILFVALALLFLLLLTWRIISAGQDLLATILLFFFCIFLFYSLNYRTLIIRLTAESLKLSFGIFSLTIPLSNVGDCQLDDGLPPLMKYGGAGIHFMVIRKRYRASFNFLEHARIVIRLKKRAGLVKEVSFSTCRPDELGALIQGAISARKTG